MSDPAITPPPPPTVPDQPTDFDISEEYGTARKNLPPAGIVLICVAVVAVIVAVYALTHRAHTVSSASIDEVNAVALPGQDAGRRAGPARSAPGHGVPARRSYRRRLRPGGGASGRSPRRIDKAARHPQ